MVLRLIFALRQTAAEGSSMYAYGIKESLPHSAFVLLTGDALSGKQEERMDSIQVRGMRGTLLSSVFNMIYFYSLFVLRK